jgi:hypothetical protein
MSEPMDSDAGKVTLIPADESRPRMPHAARIACTVLVIPLLPVILVVALLCVIASAIWEPASAFVENIIEPLWVRRADEGVSK